MAELGLNFEQLLAQEEEPGLGNGGLGRLAACFIDSLATLEVPAIGYGIRYEFGIFHQEIVDGWQIEKTDKWLRYGNPWELVRPEWSVDVKFGGTTEQYIDEHNRLRVRWVPHKTVCGVPYDTVILGYRTNTANTLRLWRSEAPESFDFAIFNSGDYYGAVNQKVHLGKSEQGAVSERHRAARQGAAARTAVFLRLLFAAGHAPHIGAPKTTRREVPREVCRPAQRHPSGHRHRRAHAAAGRRIRAAVGRRVERDVQDLRLHQSHLAAGGSRALVIGGVRQGAAAASADHLRDQRAFSRGSAHALPGRRSAHLAAVADRRDGRALRAHGAPGLRGQPRHQRRRRIAFGTAEARRAEGLLRVVAGEIQQQDQRRHAAALDGSQQSEALAASSASTSATAGSRIWRN